MFNKLETQKRIYELKQELDITLHKQQSIESEIGYLEDQAWEYSQGLNIINEHIEEGWIDDE